MGSQRHAGWSRDERLPMELPPALPSDALPGSAESSSMVTGPSFCTWRGRGASAGKGQVIIAAGR